MYVLYLVELNPESVVKVHEALVRGADHPVLTQPLDGSGQNLQKKTTNTVLAGGTHVPKLWFHRIRQFYTVAKFGQN
jgi:hypothetical protein